MSTRKKKKKIRKKRFKQNVENKGCSKRSTENSKTR